MQSKMFRTLVLPAVVLAQSPVTKVVTLLNELEARIQGDGKVEQQSYDKTACWCEETLARKAKDISDAKTKIEELQTLIEKLEGEVATHGAEIQQLNKDIAANKAAQKEATEVRKTGNEEYQATKTESEQCIGALEAAIKVLTPAGTGKAGFLSTSMQEANLISVAASLRPILNKLSQASGKISESDMEMVRDFVTKPRQVVALQEKKRMNAMLQTGNNPFGDYAPQSTQIQGVLKGLYDAFTTGLEKANGEESDAQKAYEELMATKQAELATLEATLQKQETDHAEKNKEKAESKSLRDDTEEQLKADEVFFEDTKSSCKALANDWATRSRLRTEELQGIATAKQILNSPEAQAIFANASTTFVQIEAVQSVGIRKHNQKAIAVLEKLAKKNPALAALATEAEVTGNKAFDKVIVAIDQMIADLRKEEAEDIAHRDRCQGAQNKNKNDMEDLNHAIEKTDSKLEALRTKEEELKRTIDTLIESIKTTEGEMEELLKLRNKAVADFRQALKDDTNAVELLSQALVALTEFYRKNKIEMLQKEEPEAEYSIDKDAMPKTSWQDGAGAGAYEGRKSDSQPIISMISSIKADLENEMKVAREEDAAAQTDYEKQRQAMRDSVAADTATKVATEKELGETEESIADAEDFKGRRQADLDTQGDLENTITTDCAWVETHFESRRDARKTEISGLEEAKNYLAGSEDPLE